MNPTADTTTELIELGRFFTLAARRMEAGQNAPQMFSPAIDAVWHRLAQDHRGHDAFSLRHTGLRMIHTEASGRGPITWVTAYEEMYGPLPDVWFAHADGSIDEQALARYRNHRTVVATWDCVPAPGDGDGDGDLVPPVTVR